MLTERERRTLQSICDAILPEDPSPWRASTPDRVEGLLAGLPNEDDARALRRLLRLMESGAANLLLGLRPGGVSTMGRSEREALLRAMAHHPMGQVRAGFGALKRLACLAYYAAEEDGQNPTWSRMRYPGPIAHAAGEPKPIHPVPVDRDLTLQCDAVVVGSGVGGGMVAAELAEAGQDVVVLEAGEYLDGADFSQRELEMLRRLYLGAGLLTTTDGGMVVLAGSCLGGGTVVNYTTSFRTPDSVRREWARVSGLDLFVSEAFTRSLDEAERRLGVNLNHNEPSSRDRLMRRGLESQGWHVDRMPRDVQGCTQDDVCGYCGLGCVRGAKRSSLKTSLESAYERGARILVGCAADIVQIENGRATGVRARTASGHTVTVRAREVVAAGGAIGTAGLLLRSAVSGPVGRTLWLHPTTGVAGIFDEQVRPWTGTLQALYSDQFADLDGGYGFRFETAPLHPSLLALAAPWESGRRLDHLMRLLPHLSLVGILLRDRDGGKVTINRRGEPLVTYRLSRYDRRHVRWGIEAAARVMLGAGAREVLAFQSRPVHHMPHHGPLDHWVRRVRRTGLGPNRTLYVTFHQMGTCRMGRDPETSVVSGSGEVHGARNLFVADGSLFPTASGVNPMLTIAALAHLVAQQIKDRL